MDAGKLLTDGYTDCGFVNIWRWRTEGRASEGGSKGEAARGGSVGMIS